MPFTEYENSRLRTDNLVFGLRALQVIFALTILGVAADDVTIWGPRDCNVPPKLAFNVAAAAITLPIAAYLLFTTGPLAKTFKALPWSPWLQLGVDILLFILWVAVGALSSYTCNDVCAACTPYGLEFGDYNPYYGGILYLDPIAFCPCIIIEGDNTGNFRRRSLFSRASSGHSHSGGSSSSRFSKSLEHFVAKVGLDWTMFALVVCALVGTIYLLWQERRATQPEVENTGAVDLPVKTAGMPAHTEAQTEYQLQPHYQAAPQYQPQVQSYTPQYQPQSQY